MKLTSGASRIVRSVIPSKGHLIVHQVNQYLVHNGPEWTVNRLKAIRSALYQLKAGNRDLAVRIYQHNSIAYRKKDLLPKGPFYYAAFGFITAQKPSVIRRWDGVLRLYTCIYAHTLTQTQFNKSKKAINSPFEGKDGFDCPNSQFSRFVRRRYRRMFNHIPRRLPDLGRLSPTSATHIEKQLLNGELPIKDRAFGKHVMSLWTSCFLPSSLKDYNPSPEFHQILVDSGCDSRVAGHIAFLQEGGCKARVIAVPNVWIQVILEPFHEQLSTFSNTLEGSCLFDQNEGGYFMKYHLGEGHKLHCFDLSSATDRFPLGVQRDVLKGLGLEDIGDAIKEIANAPWKVDVELNGVTIQEEWSYNVGQPMGMYTSFILFHITHLMILEFINSNLASGEKGEYRVLGDDVIIYGDKLARQYSILMRRFGVEISEAKSVSSDRLSEFAGFSAYRTNRGSTCHRPFKYGKTGMGASVPLFHAFGKSISGLSSWHRRYVELYQHTSGWRNPDLSPLFTWNDSETTAGSRLNSHQLGSLGNQLSWYLDYLGSCPSSDSLYQCYEQEQVSLLGKKEKLNSSGFASYNDNPNTFNEEETLAESAKIPVWRSHYVQLASDPILGKNREHRKMLEFIRSVDREAGTEVIPE